MKKTLTDLIADAHAKAVASGALPDNELPSWRIDVPKNTDHGDYAANVAMILASKAKMPPRQVAQALLDNLVDEENALTSADIAGPGFINFRMSPGRWHRVLEDIQAEGPEYGRSDAGEGKKIQVEFVSANPTGPLHVGHGRGAVVGDVLGRILDAAGFEVQREYYVNDAGNQIATLGGSVYYRYLELCGREVDFPDNFYQGEYIIGLARDVFSRDGDKYLELEEESAVDELGLWAGELILDGIRDDLANFGITFDNWFSERSLYQSGEVAGSLRKLEDDGVGYRSEGALWLRTTDYGDEKDRVMVRADGRETYFASDIAYHREKFSRGFDEVIDVWGADHHGYVPRMKAALDACGIGGDKLHVLMVQLVNLLRQGKPVSMSTRAGEFVTLAEVVEEVGRDAARFIFLTRSCDTPLDFDLELAKQQTTDNPVFYVQYCNARICSVFREADKKGVKVLAAKDAELSELELAEETDLVKTLYLFPEVVEGAALNREPHRVVYYLQELAAKFHSYYNKNRFITDDEDLTGARLALASCVRTVIANGLSLVGVSAPETM